MKLSVIIPVYNVENTLKRCVDSILQQSYTDYELLLIDDGSPDNSGRLADMMARKDSRIKVFHKPNGGLSDARNYGIQRASGEYITFIDSDDAIAPDTLENVMDNMDADILEYPVKERAGSTHEHIFMPSRKNYPDALEWLSEYGFEHCWACNKIFRRSFVDNVRFPVDKLYEDVYFMGELLKRNPGIASTDKGMYLYYWNEKGIVAGGNFPALLEAQIHVVQLLDIDTRLRRWHRLYLNMFTNQLHAFNVTGNVRLWRQTVIPWRHARCNDWLKALLASCLGPALACKLFRRMVKGFNRKK